MEGPLAFEIDDLFIEFHKDGNQLSVLTILFPYSAPSPEEAALHSKKSFWIHEPRAHEIEEIVLQISSGLCLQLLSQKIEIPFDARKIEWFEDGKKAGFTYELNTFRKEKKKLDTIPSSWFIRSLLTACTYRKHDPSFTFYLRGASDILAHRHIEAFYNFFFFLEYRFGNGKSGIKATVSEFLKQDALIACFQKVLTERDQILSPIISKQYISMLGQMSMEELLTHIVKIRGLLHHPNKNRMNNWHPDKQDKLFVAETLLLSYVCLQIVATNYWNQAYSGKVQRAYKKAERCIRLGKNIRVITR